MTTFLESGESSATPDDQRVFDLASGSFGHLQMTRPLEQITARGTTLRRRRAAVSALSAMACVAAITALAAAAVFPPSKAGVRTASPADGTAGVPSMTEPGWTVTAASGGGYAVDITALGDTARLNETLKYLGITIEVLEAAPAGDRSACPVAGGPAATTSIVATQAATGAPTAPVTGGASPTSSGSATVGASGAPDSTTLTTSTSAASPTPTPMSFAVSGTPAAFTLRGLPKESTVSFVSLEGQGRPVLGTVHINNECVPVAE